MSDDKSPPVRIPESEDDAVRMVEEDMDDDEELDEQKRSLIRAQATRIGDIHTDQ